MVNPIHVVFVLKEVILVNVLNLELVIFSAARDRTILVIQRVLRVDVRKTPRTDGHQIIWRQLVVAWRNLVTNSKLADVHLRNGLQKLVALSSARVSLVYQILQNGKLFATALLNEIAKEFKEFTLGDYSFHVKVEEFFKVA